MSVQSVSAGRAAGHHPGLVLLDLARRARHAATPPELAFMAVNDSHSLASYRQAALWFADQGVRALSGVVLIEANAPYALWLNAVCRHLLAQHPLATRVDVDSLPADLAAAWAEWLPAEALWVPLAGMAPAFAAGGLLLARDLPWSDDETTLLGEWMDAWSHAWRARLSGPAPSWSTWRRALFEKWRPPPGRRWWQHKPLLWLGACAALLLLPVRMTVLSPGELVPANPAVIRAPIDGVVAAFSVQPNDRVKAGQPLFNFDEALIRSRLEVARQELATAETEYRQVAQQALVDQKQRASLAVIAGKIEEKRAEALFVEEQSRRARVLAPQDGVALFDDPSEWIGKPVSVGERIIRIADPGDVEVEVWVPVADAIPLADDASLTLYLNASPLSPVSARLRYFAHDAVQRPDGTYAYRIRARLEGRTDHRVGLKGTAKLHGDWTVAVYWILRRPFATVRGLAGW